jgi:hypothetical protein
MRMLSDSLPSLCDSQRVTFDLGSFCVGAEAKAATWSVNKHYDLASSGDLEIAFDGLAALIAQGSVPNAAVTAWDKRGK